MKVDHGDGITESMAKRKDFLEYFVKKNELLYKKRDSDYFKSSLSKRNESSHEVRGKGSRTSL